VGVSLIFFSLVFPKGDAGPKKEKKINTLAGGV
jgi:hypothetical protein